MERRGRVRVDKRTKRLISRLRPGDIAVICHEDLDEVAAEGLIASRVSAVVNTADSSTGRYPNRGPLMLVEAGIHLVDSFSPALFDKLVEGEELTLRDGELFRENEWLGTGRVRTAEELQTLLHEARQRLHTRIDDFVQNTLEYIAREKDFLEKVHIPELRTRIKGRDVVVVVRGPGYKDDLAVLEPFIKESAPLLLAVDGGADALLEAGYRPHVVVGDMDSVSDEALRACEEIVVHAYPDGRAPGLTRVLRLGLKAHVIKTPGTSEDVALWLAYRLGASLLIAVGSHSNIVDFLEKGRRGMASTFLVRLVVGPILFDAKGVSRLYRPDVVSAKRQLGQLAVAASVPFLLVLALSQTFQQWFSLFWLRLRVLAGW